MGGLSKLSCPALPITHTSSFFGQFHKLLPRHLVANHDGVFIPPGQVKRGDDELRHVARVRERHLLLAVSRDRGPLAGHVDDERGLRDVGLGVGHSVVLQKPAQVEGRPLQAGLVERRVGRRVLVAVGE